MRRQLPVAIVATMSLALVVMASGAAWAPPKWRGAQFLRLKTAEGRTQSLLSASEAAPADVRQKIRVQLEKGSIPQTFRGAVPRDVRNAVWRACRPGRRIVMQSDAFTSRVASAVIEPDKTDGIRTFVLDVTLRPVPPERKLPASAKLVSCGPQRFTFDPEVGGVGAEFLVALPLTGRNQRTTAVVGLALVAGGMLLVFAGRTRRRGRPTG